MAGITSLPPEILSDILSYLPRKRDDLHSYPTNPPSEVSAYLPVYATVCKAWQQHIELQTFREIYVISCELEYWSKIMTESRRSALREIKYGIVTSEGAEAAYSRESRFTKEAWEESGKAFTVAIAEFFVLLKKWEEHTPSMSLSLEITDFYFYSNGQLERKLRLKEIEYSSYLNDYRFYTSMLQLYDPDVELGPVDDLPKLKSVTSLHLGQLSDQLHMTEDSMTRLVMKFPALKKLHLELGEMHRDNLVDPDFRYKLALSLLPLASLSLTHFVIQSYNEPESYMTNEDPPSILHSAAPGIDCLSLALYAISIIPTMKEMEIHNFMVSSQLFQPPAIIPMGSEFAYLAKAIPQWPSLKTYSIQFSDIHPSGSWYFVQHPDNPLPYNFAAAGLLGYDEFTRSRTYPQDTAVNELLGAAGNAKRKMPALQMISLVSGLGGVDTWMDINRRARLEFEATWCKAGGLQSTDLTITRVVSQPLVVSKETFLAEDRVYWCTGPGRDWHPTREVEEAWTGNGNQQWFKRVSCSFGGWLYGGELF